MGDLRDDAHDRRSAPRTSSDESTDNAAISHLVAAAHLPTMGEATDQEVSMKRSNRIALTAVAATGILSGAAVAAAGTGGALPGAPAAQAATHPDTGALSAALHRLDHQQLKLRNDLSQARHELTLAQRRAAARAAAARAAAARAAAAAAASSSWSGGTSGSWSSGTSGSGSNNGPTAAPSTTPTPAPHTTTGASGSSGSGGGDDGGSDDNGTQGNHDD
jgi:hypothetical protein